MAISIQRGAGSAALGLVGAGAVVIWPNQWLIGAVLMAAGLIVLLSGIKIGDRYWWRRPPRRILYFQSSVEQLPEETPDDRPMRIFMILPADDKIHHGWKTVRGKIDWGEPEQPQCICLRVTNHGPETLFNVILKLKAQAQVIGTSPTEIADEKEFTLPLDKIRAGDDYPLTTYIVNETRYFISLDIEEAQGGPLGKKPKKLGIERELFPGGLMALWPPRKYVTHDAAE